MKTTPKYKIGQHLVLMDSNPDFTFPLDNNMIVSGEAQWNNYGKGYWEYPIKGKANNSPEDLLLPYEENKKEYIIDNSLHGKGYNPNASFENDKKNNKKAELVIPEKAPEYCFVKYDEEVIYIGKDKEYANGLVIRLNIHDQLIKALKWSLSTCMDIQKKKTSALMFPETASLGNHLEELLKKAEQK